MNIIRIIATSIILIFSLAHLSLSQAQERSIDLNTRSYTNPNNISSDTVEILIKTVKEVINAYYNTGDFYDQSRGTFSTDKMIQFNSLFENNAIIFDYLSNSSVVSIDEFTQKIYNNNNNKKVDFDIEEADILELRRDEAGDYFANIQVLISVLSEFDKNDNLVFRNQSRDFLLDGKINILSFNLESGKFSKLSSDKKMVKSLDKINQISYGLSFLYGNVSTKSDSSSTLSFNSDNINSGSFGAGIFLDYLMSISSNNKTFLNFGLDIDFHSFSNSISDIGDLETDVSVTDIPIFILENEEIIQKEQPGTLNISSLTDYQEKLKLLSISPRLGLSKVISEDKDFSHRLNIHASGEVWISSFQNNANSTFTAIVVPDESEYPFPDIEEIPVDILSEHYSIEGDLDANIDDINTNLGISIGGGYTYQKFTDYNKGFLIGLEVNFYPKFLSKSSDASNAFLTSEISNDLYSPSSDGNDYLPVNPPLLTRSNSVLNQYFDSTSLLELKIKFGLFNRTN